MTNSICLACTGNTIIPGAKHQDCMDCSRRFRSLIVECTVCNDCAIAGDTERNICIFCYLQFEDDDEYDGVWDWDNEDFIYGEQAFREGEQVDE